MVPMNAALQDIGHRSIGSGRAVALQSFFENSAMLVAVGGYTASVGAGAGPVNSILVVGILVLIATALVSWRLPPIRCRSIEPWRGIAAHCAVKRNCRGDARRRTGESVASSSCGRADVRPHDARKADQTRSAAA